MRSNLVTGFTAVRDGYLLIVEAHVAERTDVVARMTEANQLMDETGIRRIVVDASFVDSAFSVDDLGELSDIASQLVGPAERIGLFRDRPMLEDRFVTLVERFREKGVNIRLFTSMKDAKAWALG